MSVLPQIDGREALAELSRFRAAFYGCLSARADAFFELADALLCTDGPTRTPVELSLLAEHQRGYGSLYGALNHGRLDANALRDLLASLPFPRFDGRIVLTVDVSPRLCSDAACSPDRLFCLVHGRNGRSSDHVVPGWPYSFFAVLTPDRTSWTRVLDVVRLGPAGDAAAVTADQLRTVVERLIAAGQWQRGDRDVLVVMDAGYDVMRLAWVMRDLPVELVGRLRSDRVLRRPAPSLKEYSQSYPQGGRPPKHGKEFSLARPASWPEPSVITVNDTARYGKAEAWAWGRLHPKPQQRSAWIDHDSELPVVEGTLIRLQSITCPATGMRRRSGRGPPRPAPPRTTSTSTGRATCADSTWSTPFACSSSPSAGRGQGFATRRQRTAGPGS